MSSPKHYPTFKVVFATALARYLEVSTEPIILAKVTGRIDSGGASDDYYIQLLCASALPADTTVVNNANVRLSPLKLTHTNGVDTTFDIDFGPDFVKCPNGLFVVASTTEFTKTIVTADLLACTVFYH